MTTSPLDPIVQRLRRMAGAHHLAGLSDAELLARFVATRDDAAVTALVRRHGPMVLGVCRRLLRHVHDAEDVCQATFLVLLQKAASIRRRTSVASWLHGVACHLAVKVRAARRPTAELTDADPAGPEPGADLTWHELQTVLDAELRRLPERYRQPLVLCYLEGLTREEAARQLGCTHDALKGRLERGRDRLRDRLTRRGLTLSAALWSAVLSEQSLAASLPARLVVATVRSAAQLAAGESPATVLTESVAALVTGARLAGQSTLWRGLIAVAATVGMFGVGVGAFRGPTEPPMNGAPVTPEAIASMNSPPQVEGDPLPARAVVRLGTDRYRNGDRIESMAVSADGRLAVTAAGSGPYTPTYGTTFRRAYVFDLTDGRRLYSPAQQHGREIEAVGLSPDGKTLAGKDSAFLYFWDAATGQELRKLNYVSAAGGGRSPTDWITFTPDGQQVAVTLMGDAVQLIDVGTGQVKSTFHLGGAARACVFSPDGTLMATGGYGSENNVYYARLWEVATGKELRRFAIGREINRPIGALALLARRDDARRLRGRDGRLHLFEVATGKELNVFPKIGEDVRGVAFAPDGKTVAAAGDNVHLYDPVTGKERLRIERRARGLAFSRDGAILTGAVGGAIYRWDAASGRQLTPATAQDSAVEQIVVSADGRRLFTTDQDGDLYVWDAAGGQPPRRIASGVERGVVASADRRFLTWAAPADYGNSRIRLYNTAADRITDLGLRSSEGFSVIAGTATVAAFLPDGKSLLTFHGGPPPSYRLWDVESGQERRSFAVGPPRSNVRPRGAASAEDRVVPVRLWDVATGQAGRELNEPMPGLDVPDEAGFGDTSFLGGPPLPAYTIRQEALSPDGTTLAVGPNWAETFSKRRMKSMDGRAFSPDGRLLVDWAENPLGPSRLDHVHVWDAATGRAVATLTTDRRNGASNVAFAPDGRTLATASADGVIRLWEVATWKVRAEFRGHRDRVTALAFGPDGRLFTGGLDSVVFGWDVRPPREASQGTLADAWEALADSDSKVAFQAQGRLLAEPGQAVNWLAARVTPSVQPDPARVTALVADLDNPNFATRERATVELKEYGPLVADALRAVVAQSPSAESRRRAEGLLRDTENGVIPPSELRSLRAVEVLEWIGTPEARSQLLKLTKGVAKARLTRAAAAACQRAEGQK